MSFADCNACVRRHRRPVNTKCEYLKVAVEKCVSLGFKSSDYMLHLPELLPEDVDPKMAGAQTKGDTIHSQGVVDNDLVAQLVAESVQSRKLLESSQSQVERMMAQLLDLKIDQTRGQRQGSRSVPDLTSEAIPIGPHEGNTGSTLPKPMGLFPPGLNGGSQPLNTTAVTTTSVLGSTATAGATWTSAQPAAAAWPGYTVPLPSGPWAGPWAASAPSGAATTSGASPVAPPPGIGAVGQGGVTSLPPSQARATNPYLPPYLLPGANQQTSVQVPFRCETDHIHPPRHTCTTAKRKLLIYDLEVHMRYASSSSVTIEDVISGSLSLMESMMRQGVDCTGYVRHIRFMVEKSKIYSPSALIGYDAELRERAEYYGSSVFTYGDHDLTHRWLGVEALKSTIGSVSQGSTQSQSGVRKKVAKSNKYGSCWGWNESKQCKSTPCKYKHVCASCQGDHKQLDCPSKPVTPKSTK